MERYASGTSLRTTNKEDAIDSLERALWAEFSDEFCCALKKLSLNELQVLHKAIQERVCKGLLSLAPTNIRRLAQIEAKYSTETGATEEERQEAQAILNKMNRR